MIDCQRRDSLKVDTLYGSSLFRKNHILDGGVTEYLIITNITKVSHCLIYCNQYKTQCKSFNFGNNTCILMTDSVCANETLLLTPKPGFDYFDIMDTPEFERKHLKDGYCQQMGKCSGHCYPRKPHYVDTPMTWTDARQFCQQLGRSLPQPRTIDENAFYGKFIKQLLSMQPNIRSDPNMKYWFGLSDRELESVWMYIDDTPVSDSFSAWALGQPDNGGPFGRHKEDCGAISEKSQYKWLDINCKEKLKFFCA
ncbi:C-type lectin domain family 4 member E-like [Oppia nitens]|uniref:C-type lectin domain family 4 member E-like n=1 Tax=Oppia nitens TaxID=1686743 RepID=UPI0023DBD566|nr:C-type lectin domain family 4 member E-like [Oppia nitens]